MEYLAFEGGGGKGVTYVGAIKALRRLGVLPVQNKQIKGISGASAGAITALLLAMGFDDFGLAKVLSDPRPFVGFFDDPRPAYFRGVVNNRAVELHHAEVQDPGDPGAVEAWRYGKSKEISESVYFLAHHLIPHLVRAHAPDHELAKRVAEETIGCVYNLIFDRGLFPGFAVRRWFQQLMVAYLDMGGSAFGESLDLRELYAERGETFRESAGALSFKEFEKLSGIELVITGTNISRRRPAVFSARHTPDFPVIEAAAISMNLPFIFKPIHIKMELPVGELHGRKDDYDGLWIDGGTLNNFPLHAFDHRQPPISSQFPRLRPLHPRMLGIRLTDGPCSRPRTPGTYDALLELFGDVLGTLMYPAEDGQIRSPDEIDQTIELNTFCLSTTEFAPSADKRRRPIAEAEKAVLGYFRQLPMPETP